MSSTPTGGVRGALLIAWIACTLLACMATPALAAAGHASDAAATRAYLRASDQYALHASAELPERLAALGSSATDIARECPSVLTYAPRDEAFGQLSDEIVTVVVYASAASERSMSPVSRPAPV